MKSSEPSRRDFAEASVGITAAAALGSWNVPAVAADKKSDKKTRIGIIGCGSVSGVYLPHLSNCPYAELVSACDIKPERAKARAEQFKIPNQYPHIDKMLTGAAFDLLVNTTDMQEHEH